jgi:hypothetical protein
MALYAGYTFSKLDLASALRGIHKKVDLCAEAKKYGVSEEACELYIKDVIDQDEFIQRVIRQIRSAQAAADNASSVQGPASPPPFDAMSEPVVIECHFRDACTGGEQPGEGSRCGKGYMDER